MICFGIAHMSVVLVARGATKKLTPCIHSHYCGTATSPPVGHTSVHSDIDHEYQVDGCGPKSSGVGTALLASTAFQKFFSSASHLTNRVHVWVQSVGALRGHFSAHLYPSTTAKMQVRVLWDIVFNAKPWSLRYRHCSSENTQVSVPIAKNAYAGTTLYEK